MGKVYEDDTDEEVANRSEESQAIANETKGDTMLKAMRDTAAKPKPRAMAKTTPKTSNYSNEGRSTPAPAAKSDVTKMSLSERAAASRESARSGSGPTDTRSVGERLRSAFGGKDRGGNTVDFGGSGVGMAKGGSASSRADGIATKGKTRGTIVMCGGGYSKGKK
jgi:hypothetical protein